MKLVVFTVVAAVALVAIPQAQEIAPVTEVSGMDELVKEKGRFKQTWVHPEADLSRYHKLYLAEAEFQFRERGDTPFTGSLISTKYRQSEQEAEAERKRFEQVFAIALVEELEAVAELQLVDQAGPDTLFLRTRVLDMMTNVPPDDLHHTLLWNIGAATVVFELIDLKTGVIQASFAERMSIQPPHRNQDLALTMPTNSARVWLDIERWAHRAAADLRHELKKRTTDS